MQQEVDVGLLEFQFARLLQSLHEGVLKLQFPDKPDSRAELVREEQDKAMGKSSTPSWSVRPC